jgi:hypothetical protein
MGIDRRRGSKSHTEARRHGELAATEGDMTSFIAPGNNRASVHVVLQATDDGSPVTAFRRVVVTIGN